MRTVRDKYYGITTVKYYLYRSDLEKFSTRRLIGILRRLRSAIHCLPWDYFERTPIEDLENSWLEYSRLDGGSKLYQEQFYAMIWMVKDVLSRREHVPTSKIECRRIRQMKAKNRSDRRTSTHFCGRGYSRS